MSKERSGFHRALKGIAITFIGLFIIVSMLPNLAVVRQEGRRAACKSNLGMIGKALTFYAGDHDGKGRNILFVDCHVEWNRAEDFPKKLKEMLTPGYKKYYTKEAIQIMENIVNGGGDDGNKE